MVLFILFDQLCDLLSPKIFQNESNTLLKEATFQAFTFQALQTDAKAGCWVHQ